MKNEISTHHFRCKMAGHEKWKHQYHTRCKKACQRKPNTSSSYQVQNGGSWKMKYQCITSGAKWRVMENENISIIPGCTRCKKQVKENLILVHHIISNQIPVYHTKCKMVGHEKWNINASYQVQNGGSWKINDRASYQVQNGRSWKMKYQCITSGAKW